MGAARKVCVLVSGGLDSAVLLKLCLERFREVHPLYVEAGLRWERAECYWLGRLLRVMRTPRLKPLQTVFLSASTLYRRHWSLGDGRVPSEMASWDSVYLPGRNLLLLSAAGTFCASRGIGNIAIGTLAGNPFADSRPAFFREMERIFRRLFAPIRVLAPMRSLHKDAVVRLGADLPLHLTFSCLAPRGLKPCGKCTKCFERRQGFPIRKRTSAILPSTAA